MGIFGYANNNKYCAVNNKFVKDGMKQHKDKQLQRKMWWGRNKMNILQTAMILAAAIVISISVIVIQ